MAAQDANAGWEWPPPVPARVSVEKDPLLWAAEAAKFCGLQKRTWNKYVQAGLAPCADDPDDQRPAGQRMPRWRKSRVVYFTEHRVGQGKRADLRKTA